MVKKIRSISMQESLIERVKKEAKNEGRSFSSMVCRLLVESLNTRAEKKDRYCRLG